MRSLGEDLFSQLWANGTAFSDAECKQARGMLIRVNPDEKLCGIVRQSVSHLAPLLVSLQMGAKEALIALEK
jgi:hypothetical protein